jgi:hypothetical protein
MVVTAGSYMASQKDLVISDTTSLRSRSEKAMGINTNAAVTGSICSV